MWNWLERRLEFLLGEGWLSLGLENPGVPVEETFACADAQI